MINLGLKILKWGNMSSFSYFSESCYQKILEDGQKCCTFYFLMHLFSAVDS